MEISTKKVSLVLILILVLISTELSMGVHCRAIKDSMAPTKNTGRVGLDPSSVDMDDFVVSSNNSSNGGSTSLKGLAFKLASGPSKKGPGH
ncbi:hypothetical protein LIER_38543 [Lithospermum erythrorhizon]|uniref:Uncharacterized protein n=1 Tax=Lithospermum erythrorhizon TaxID=34254 RepID=A0AAV3Q2D9_LITER